MKFIQTTFVPKKAISNFEFRDDAVPSVIDDLMLWMKENLTGTVWWSKTNFRDPSAPNSHRHYSSMQKHFTDGYWVYRFWFSQKSDAAKFVIFWRQ